MVHGMKVIQKMDKDMAKENSFIKQVVYMTDNGKTVKLMDLEHFIMLVEILLIMDNGKMKCLMEEVLFIMIILNKMKNLIILILVSFRKCGLNIKEILNMMQKMELELFI